MNKWSDVNAAGRARHLRGPCQLLVAGNPTVPKLNQSTDFQVQFRHQISANNNKANVSVVQKVLGRHASRIIRLRISSSLETFLQGCQSLSLPTLLEVFNTRSNLDRLFRFPE